MNERIYYPVGTIVTVIQGTGWGYDFYKVMNHTKNGSPRLQQLRVELYDEYNDPAQGTAKVRVTNELIDMKPKAARWSDRQISWMLQGQCVFEYNSILTYRQNWYG